MTEQKPERRDRPYFPKPDDFEPEATFGSDHTWAGQKRCTGWNYRQGRQCGRKPIKGKTKCKHHGGASLGGLASPVATNLTHSKYIVARLADNYHELAGLGDNLFSIQHELALLKTLVNDSLSRMDSGESGAAWGKAAQLHKDLEQIQRRPATNDQQRADNAAAFTQVFLELGQILRRQAMAYAARDEVLTQVEHVRRFVADDNRAKATKYKSMREDEVLLLMAAMVGMLKDILGKRVGESAKNQVLNDMQEGMNVFFSNPQ